jgi:hypothetical protein
VTNPWHVPTEAESVAGKATFYAPGMMERVAMNRGLIREAEEYDKWLEERGLAGAVALNAAGDLGRVVWLESPAGDVAGPFLAIDCAQAEHYQDRLDRERVVEVDWPTAVRWQMRGPVDVRVWFHPPHRGSVHVPIPI